jgi:hypothetical protein
MLKPRGRNNMLTFDLKCPLCGVVFQVEEAWIGQTGECTECGGEILIRKTLALANPIQIGKKPLPEEGKTSEPKLHVRSDAQSASTAEMKDKIKGFFVEITEDRFTKFRHVKTKESIRLEEILELYSVLDMGIVYVKKNDIGSVCFTFTYSRDCDNEISDTCIDLKMSLVLDGDKSVELTDSSGWESDFSVGDKGHLIKEKIQLAVPIPDLAEIAKAHKIEYTVKTGSREIKGSLLDRKVNQLMILKGFYNNVFDEAFELQYLYSAFGLRQCLKPLLP